LITGVLYVVDPDMIRPLFRETYGQLVLVAVVVLEVVGWLMIRKIVAIDI
jgi:tight adherence protein B